MFRTMKYHYKCNDIEKKILMFMFHILRKSKPKDDEEIYHLRDRGLTIPKRL